MRETGLWRSKALEEQVSRETAGGRLPVHSEAGTCVGIWKVKVNLIYDSLENFDMQEGEYNLRD